MAKFMDKLRESKQSLDIEIFSLELIMKTDCAWYGSLYDAAEKNFLSWKHRQNFITLGSCMERTGINRIIEKAESEDSTPSKVAKERKKHVAFVNEKCCVEEYLDYAEFIMNILPVALISDVRGATFYHALLSRPEDLQYNQIEESGFVNSIIQNIINTLESLKYTFAMIDGVYRIISKDPVMSEVAVKMQENKPKLVDDIFMYRHRENSGNLKEKSAILARLNIYFEGELKKLLIANNYLALVKDIGFIANKMPEIRHCEDKKFGPEFEKMDDAQKEAWFDKLFTLFLCAIELKEHAAIHKDIKDLIAKVEGSK